MTNVEILEQKVKNLEIVLRAEQQHIKRLYEIIDRLEGRKPINPKMFPFRMFEPADGFLKSAPSVCGNCKYWFDEKRTCGNVKVCFIDGKQKEAGKLCDTLNTKMDCEMKQSDK